MPGMDLKGLLFDWGGVFTHGTFDGRVTENLSRYFERPLDAVRRAYFAEVERLELGEWSLKRFWEHLQEALDLHAPYPVFERLFLGSVAPNAAMYDLLAALPEGLVVGLLSNNYPVISRYLRAGEGFDRFDAVVFSNEEGVKKPSPEAYLLALERMNLAPGEVLFVDDNPENLAAAERLGLSTHRFTDARTLSTELARRGLALPAGARRP